MHTAILLGVADIAQNSLVWWAVGVRPYKDATFTGTQTWGQTTCMQGAGNDAPYTMPEWWGLQDPKPALGVNDFDINLIHLSSLASTNNAGFSVPRVYIALIDASSFPSDWLTRGGGVFKSGLQVVVSAMAAGPIAGCDGIGDVDRTLLMRMLRHRPCFDAGSSEAIGG